MDSNINKSNSKKDHIILNYKDREKEEKFLKIREKEFIKKIWK